MQTDCPTERVRDRQMKGNRNGRMRLMIVSRMTGLDEKKKKLPRTRDPEFAKPKSQGKKTDKDTRTEKYSKEEKEEEEDE